ncbi:MAG: acyl-CoA thioester hydrolase [Ruminococcus sp.]|nr:acyl-CoA thioester hydrolase [Ruminococcus sp.]MCM1380437.1 acyl-CoA thioester hydrolase [Muribaculaceae bacterium]MCM1478407.1 acyl-CoA thioester hydrolase [Muribaculaceae bacterium]
MKKIKFETKKDGFFGIYFENPVKTNAAMIIIITNNAESYIAVGAAKWAVKNGLNAMTVSPEKEEKGYHNFPIERIENAVNWLKNHGNSKIAIAGASATGTVVLAAAAHIPDITLTIAMTPSDFMWEGFKKINIDGCKEMPVEGTALLSYKGEPLPYMPFAYRHPDYWNVMMTETKETGNKAAARRVYDDSEKAHPIAEDEYIKIENIKGLLILVGAKDDTLWDTEKYIRRMERRLKSTPHDCKCKILLYEHGTHFVFPESMLKMLLPVGSGLLTGLVFKAAREFPEECGQTRLDIDKKIKAAVLKWKRG